MNIQEETEEGKLVFLHIGQIDFVQLESSPTGNVLAILNVNKDESVVFVVDPRNFVGSACKMYCLMDA